MKDHRYILHTESPHGSRQRVWNTRRTVDIGHPARFHLRQESRTRFHLRDLATREEKALSWNDLEKGVPISGNPTAPYLRIRLSALTTPPAAFRPMGPIPSHSTQLYVYRSIAQWMLEADPIADAFVGFKRGTPVLSLNREGDRYRVRSLGGALRVKTRGTELRILKPGEEVTLTVEEVHSSILVSGAHNWRFGFVDLSNRSALDLPDPERDPDSVWSRAFAALAFAMLFGFFCASWWEQSIFRRESTEPRAREYKVVAEETRFVLQRPKSSGATKAIIRPETAPEKAIAKTIEPVAPPAPASRPKPAPPKKVSIEKPVAPRAPTELESLKAVIAGSVKSGAALSDQAAKARADSESQDWFDGSQVSPSETIAPAIPGTETSVRSVGGATGTSGYAAENELGEVSSAGASLKADWVHAGGEQLSVEDGLSKGEVGDVIRANLREVRYCYEQASRRFPKIQGKLLLSFVIGARGEVQNAQVKSSSVTQTGIDACVVQRLWAWKFPQPKGGKPVEVEFPFVFRTLGNREVQW